MEFLTNGIFHHKVFLDGTNLVEETGRWTASGNEQSIELSNFTEFYDPVTDTISVKGNASGHFPFFPLGYKQTFNRISQSVDFLFLLSRTNLNADSEWREKSRNKSIKLLTDIVSTNNIQQVLGNGGVFLTLTNGDWIAIRVIVEFEPDREIALAVDSRKVLYESNRLFSGGLTSYPRFKKPLPPGGRKIATPECFVCDMIERSPNLDEARIILKKHFKFVPIGVPTE